jgi:transcriptional regulator with XRE-family HTH domain
VSLTAVELRRAGASPFPRLLKEWRQKRRLSQLGLALESGVSQRHVSFLESGRAKPSRSMILQLSETLEVPLRARNDWLAAASRRRFARALDDPDGQVMNAVRRMLAGHESPCRGHRPRLEHQVATVRSRAGRPLGEDVGPASAARDNLMRLVFHPRGSAAIANWREIAPLVCLRAARRTRRR